MVVLRVNDSIDRVVFLGPVGYKNSVKKMIDKVAARIFGEKRWMQRVGDFRTREKFGLAQRPNYAYGMLRAADVAKYFGKTAVTAVEFGVASGHGLTNMAHLAELIEQETGVRFRLFGFDTGSGLPAVSGFKDHPEIWRSGDFAMEDRAALERRLSGRAKIIWGDIADTIGSFTAALDPDAPLGFVSVDVDIYTATVSALKCLTGAPETCSPAVSMYFDDVSFFFANRWAGELAAIEEFNAAQESRKIDHDRSLPGGRRYPHEWWYRNMYTCHVLDHEARAYSKERPELAIGAHHEFMRRMNLY